LLVKYAASLFKTSPGQWIIQTSISFISMLANTGTGTVLTGTLFFVASSLPDPWEIGTDSDSDPDPWIRS
jgi:hypothetical protein